MDVAHYKMERLLISTRRYSAKLTVHSYPKNSLVLYTINECASEQTWAINSSYVCNDRPVLLWVIAIHASFYRKFVSCKQFHRYTGTYRGNCLLQTIFQLVKQTCRLLLVKCRALFYFSLPIKQKLLQKKNLQPLFTCYSVVSSKVNNK